ALIMMPDPAMGSAAAQMRLFSSNIRITLRKLKKSRDLPNTDWHDKSEMTEPSPLSPAHRSESFLDRRTLLRLIIVTTAYIVSGRLGLMIPYVAHNITLIWPPTGIAIAALLRWGRMQGIAIFIGAVTVNLMIRSPVLLALGIGLGN